MKDVFLSAALSSPVLAAFDVSQPAPTELFTWLGCLAFFLVVADKVITVWRSATGDFRKHGEQPNLQTLPNCQSIHKALADHLDARFDKLSTEIKTLGTAAETRASRIHSRIDPLAEQTSSNRDTLSNHLEDHRAGRLV